VHDCRLHGDGRWPDWAKPGAQRGREAAGDGALSAPGGYAPAFITASAEQPAAPAHRTHWITRHPQADRIVSRARSLRRTGNHAAINEAIALLTELTVSIPDCGPAFAALSLCYSLREDAQLYCGLEAKARTKTLAMQALALAPDCAESWIALGCARLFFDWDFRHGHECLEQARALDPADGLASALLASFFHLRQGDFSEADVLLMEAVRLSPGDAVVQFLRAWSLFCQRRYPESLAVLEVQAKMSPPSALAAGLLPWVLAFSGKRLRAMDATACMPQSQEWMRAWLLLRGGVQEEATLLLQAFEAGQTGPEVSDLFPTLLLAETGNCEHAAALLARAARKRLPYALFVERDPRFDSIRDIRSSVETQSIS